MPTGKKISIRECMTWPDSSTHTLDKNGSIVRKKHKDTKSTELTTSKTSKQSSKARGSSSKRGKKDETKPSNGSATNKSDSAAKESTKDLVKYILDRNGNADGTAAG